VVGVLTWYARDMRGGAAALQLASPAAALRALCFVIWRSARAWVAVLLCHHSLMTCDVLQIVTNTATDPNKQGRQVSV